ncbi:MAG: hypothetical protein U9R52_04470, partial [Candidatus Omnitrophota bacterium]|nr:hypothetical protein [Candidatus Omnitrophota bacterium]
MTKLRYEVDPHNRLVVRQAGKKAGISKFRRVIEGKFKTGNDNTLFYHIKAPSRHITPEYRLPHQLKLKGKWSLTGNHDLKLTLNKWRRQGIGDELTLKGEFIKTETNSLLFAITQRTKENAASTYILRLQGIWQADKNNRLTFRIKREKSNYDTLAFDGIWQVDKKHRVLYRDEKKLSK